MKHKALFLIITLCSLSTIATAESNQNLQQGVARLQKQSEDIQRQLKQLQKELVSQSNVKKTTKPIIKASASKLKPKSPLSVRTKHAGKGAFHSSAVTVHSLESDPESMEFYPTALVADERVVTYIAGTPVVSSPYLGSRPAFDGSDYIVNISSINRDIRLMQQRRRLYRAYEGIGYPIPQMPIIAISGKVEPDAVVGDPFEVDRSADFTLGSGELDVAAILNQNVEAYISFAYDSSPPDIGGQRLSNSSVDLNMGFVNIGNLDKTPFYFTGGQLYVPFGRFASAMVSAPLTMIMARTKSRPFIFGYKSQQDSGPFAAVYGFKSDTNFGSTGVGGVNMGYIIDTGHSTGEIGASFISSIDDAGGMQFTGSKFGTTFGGFSSPTNGSESVKKIPGIGAHWHLSIDRYNFTAEWVGTTSAFREQDLSFNGRGARPQAAQLEAAITFKTFEKPASLALGYQWSKETLALNLPQQRVNTVFNISIWKDTIESLEYRHDINYNKYQYANGAAPTGDVNANTYGRGGSTNTLLLQIGVFF